MYNDYKSETAITRTAPPQTTSLEKSSSQTSDSREEKGSAMDSELKKLQHIDNVVNELVCVLRDRLAAVLLPSSPTDPQPSKENVLHPTPLIGFLEQRTRNLHVTKDVLQEILQRLSF